MNRIVGSFFAALLLCVLGVATPALAGSLAPGATISPVPLESGLFTTLASTGIQPFSFAGDTGSVEELAGTFTGNPFGATDMTFVFQFTVTAGVVANLSSSSFAGWGVDVGAAACCLPGFSTGTNAPLSAQRTSDGSVVQFNFLPEVGAGGTSFILIVNTNAPGFSSGFFGLLDGGGQTFNGFAPSNVPEPASLSLLGTGLLAMGGLLRKKLLS